jgi:hypothetical protein
MAITGSGTAASPYIVTTSAELKDAMETHHSTGDYLYVELGNTIDLQFSNFEKIQTSDAYDHIDLNLAGYAIQNIFLTDAMFELQKADVIHDGKILNLLTAPTFNTEYFISKGLFTNVSASTYADVPTYSIFHSTRFLRSAASMRYKTAKPIDDGTIFKSLVLRGADTTAESSMIEESDIKIIIDEFNAVDAEFIAQAAGASNIKDSRITGEIKVFNNADAQYYPKLSGITMVNSVVNFAVPDYTGSGSAPGASHYFCKGNTTKKSIVNTEILSSAYTAPVDNGCIECTSNDMRNAAVLWGKGFECYSLSNIL